MKRFFLVIAILLATTVPIADVRAEAICACYFGEHDDCEYFYDPDGASFAVSRDECLIWCQEDERHPDATREGWAADSESEEGTNVIEECNLAADEVKLVTPEEEASSSSSSSSSSSAAAVIPGFATPQLSIQIPNLSFSQPTAANGYMSVNFIGEYVAAIYKFLIGFSATVAIVMMMIGGLQYVVGASSGQIGKAKERITNAISGFVLLLFVFVILYTVNPELTFFDSLSLQKLELVKLNIDTMGPEGEISSCGGITSITDLPEPYKTIVASAKAEADKQCPLRGTDPFDSPTGGPPSCGSHHWYDGDANGNWGSIHKLDWRAPWGSDLKAPFAGTVSYFKPTRTDNACGNMITLKGEGGVIAYICHAKDFVDASGNPIAGGTKVAKGAVIGHVGGRCCVGQTVPAGWGVNGVVGECKGDTSGSMCNDPFSSESCSCQPIAQSGNTTGTHVHISWSGTGNILSCLDD